MKGNVEYPANTICRILKLIRRDGKPQYTAWYMDEEYGWVELDYAPFIKIADARIAVADFMIGYKLGMKAAGKKVTKNEMERLQKMGQRTEV